MYIWGAAETPLEQCYSRGRSTEGGLRRTLWLPALPRSIFIKNCSTEGLRRGSTEAPSQKLSRRDPPEGTLNWLSSTEGVYGVYIYIYIFIYICSVSRTFRGVYGEVYGV